MRHSRWGEFLTAAASSAAFLPLSATSRVTCKSMGYSHFFPGEFIRNTGPSRDSDFF